jgi:beta-phosphoglucomutase family hydrolase
MGSILHRAFVLAGYDTAVARFSDNPKDRSMPPSLSERLFPIRAYLFDLDGVLTPTALVHMRAWSRLFTAYLGERGIEQAYSDADYFAYIDGRPRYDGVRALLESRGIELPEGTPDDPPDAETVCGLGNRKNSEFNAALAEDGVAAYPGSVRLLDALALRHVDVAVVSSSRNAVAVLEAAGLRDRFAVVVDGVVGADERLAGKPAPDTYLRAAELVGRPASECAVVEDAVSGAAAGRSGNFGLVIGVDRGVGANSLIEAGADLVVSDLAELVPAIEDSPEERQ